MYKEFMNQNETLIYLESKGIGKSRGWLERSRHIKGDAPRFAKFGRSVRYRKEWIDAWIKKCAGE